MTSQPDEDQDLARYVDLHAALRLYKMARAAKLGASEGDDAALIQGFQHIVWQEAVCLTARAVSAALHNLGIDDLSAQVWAIAARHKEAKQDAVDQFWRDIGTFASGTDVRGLIDRSDVYRVLSEATLAVFESFDEPSD